MDAPELFAPLPQELVQRSYKFLLIQDLFALERVSRLAQVLAHLEYRRRYGRGLPHRRLPNDPQPRDFRRLAYEESILEQPRTSLSEILKTLQDDYLCLSTQDLADRATTCIIELRSLPDQDSSSWSAVAGLALTAQQRHDEAAIYHNRTNDQSETSLCERFLASCRFNGPDFSIPIGSKQETLNTALLYTARCGNLERFKALQKENTDYGDAIVAAAAEGHIDILERLNINAQNAERIQEAIEEATSMGQPKAVERLLKAGGRMGSATDISSALNMALVRADSVMLAVMLAHDRKWARAILNNGLLLLTMFSRVEDFELCSDSILLLTGRGGIHIDAVDQYGRTVLHHAILSKNISFLRAVLAAQPDVGVIDDTGQGALELASNQAFDQAVRLLQAERQPSVDFQSKLDNAMAIVASEDDFRCRLLVEAGRVPSCPGKTISEKAAHLKSVWIANQMDRARACIWLHSYSADWLSYYVREVLPSSLPRILRRVSELAVEADGTRSVRTVLDFKNHAQYSVTQRIGQAFLAPNQGRASTYLAWLIASKISTQDVEQLSRFITSPYGQRLTAGSAIKYVEESLLVERLVERLTTSLDGIQAVQSRPEPEFRQEMHTLMLGRVKNLTAFASFCLHHPGGTSLLVEIIDLASHLLQNMTAV